MKDINNLIISMLGNRDETDIPILIDMIPSLSKLVHGQERLEE